MEIFEQNTEGLFGALEEIKRIPDNVFSDILSDEQKMNTIRDQFTRLNSNRKVGDGKASTRFFDTENDRDLLNRIIVYYKARIDWTNPKQQGIIKQNIACFSQDDGISWINGICDDAGISFIKPTIKTEQEKDAEQAAGRDAVEAHLTGKKKPVRNQQKPIPMPETVTGEQDQEQPKELIPISALDCMKITPKRYILDGLIEDETITLFSGREKIGKTYVLMNMALCMAAKTPWLELETMSDVDGCVLWLNLDMSRNTASRRIYEITHGISESWNVRDQHLFDRFFMMDGQTFRDADCKDSFEFFGDSDAVQRLQEFIISRNVKVCFIDNLIQIEGAAQENSSNDIQKVFNRVKLLRDITHCSFILIHHTTKDGGRGRGSSDIFGETDLNLQLDQCTNPKQLLLKTDGARNTAMMDIGMMKNFMQRIDDDGNPMTDTNGHAVNIFKLERIDTDGLETENSVKKTKSNATADGNIEQIKKLFSKNGNAALTKTAIVSECNKLPDCKLSGQRQAQLDAVDIAYDRGILKQNTAGQYILEGGL